MFWRAIYISGESVRTHDEDYIEFYFNELGYKIYLIYADEQHRSIKEYRAEYPDGNTIDTFKTMKEAQFKISDLISHLYNK